MQIQTTTSGRPFVSGQDFAAGDKFTHANGLEYTVRDWPARPRGSRSRISGTPCGRTLVISPKVRIYLAD